MNEQLDRAEWQRGEGMVMFRQMSDGLFRDDEISQSIDASLPDAAIANALLTVSQDYPRRTYRQAYEVSSLLINMARLRYTGNALIHDIKTDAGAAQRLDAMTFADSDMQLYDEVVSSVTTLPLNLIEMAQFKANALQPAKTIYQNLGGIASIMTSEWFGSVVDQAAFTKNAFWGTLSNLPLLPLSGTQVADYGTSARIAEIGFDYHDSAGDTIFDFDTSTKELLLSNLRDTNKNFRSAAPVITAGEIEGTTSGCPARFHHAIVEPEVAADLTKRYGKPTKELIGPRDTNGIQDSLACLGRLLERAAIIDAEMN